MNYIWAHILQAGKHRGGVRITDGDVKEAARNLALSLRRRIVVPALWRHPAGHLKPGAVSREAVEMSSLSDEFFSPHISGNALGVFGRVCGFNFLGDALAVRLAIPDESAAEYAALHTGWSPALVPGRRGYAIEHVCPTNSPRQRGLCEPLALELTRAAGSAFEMSTLGPGERDDITDRCARAALSHRGETYADFCQRGQELLRAAARGRL